jgi:hypothetical protein
MYPTALYNGGNKGDYMTPQQKQQILQGFIDYKIKQGHTGVVIREVSPTAGYYLSGAFYSDESILAPFIAAYDKIKADRVLTSDTK